MGPTYGEYPEALRQALGVRYSTVCELVPEPRGFDHPLLLRSDKPFDTGGQPATARSRCRAWRVLDADLLDESRRPDKPAAT